MASVVPIPSVQDLKLKFQETVLVSPLEKTERKSIFLSNIDQMHNYYAHTAHFFTTNTDFPPEVVTKRLKMALEKVLVPYDFAAGRLKTNQESGRLEIDCNAAGAGFVAASSEYSLHDLGDDLVFSNPGFRQLSVRFDFLPPQDHPLLILQVTSFKCGGFAIGTLMNHVLVDGNGAQKLLANLATQAFDGDKPPLHVIPCNNRHLITARSPPIVSFPHPEFSIPGPRYNGHLDTQVFKLTPSAINYLKDKASSNSCSTTKLSRSTITTYNVVAALVWRCKALSANFGDDKESVSTLFTSMDIRSRLSPPLPPSYCGNAVLYADASAKCGDIKELQYYSKLVELVWEGPKRFSDAYARSVIDLLEIEKWKMRPRIEYNVTSWLKLGFDQVVYPWGKPLCVGPISTVLAHACFLFPSVDGGVNALVSLPTDHMERFQAYFHDFFL